MPNQERIIECQQLWHRHQLRLLRLAIGTMALVAIVWLGYEFWRLLWAAGGATDLIQRMEEVRGAFKGQSVYKTVSSAVYPPASYVMLWPILGWAGEAATRWLWAITMVAALVWLVRLVVRESMAETPLERVFVALMPLAMYATGATIGNGQHLVHLIPMVIAAVLLLRDSSTLLRDLMVAALMLFCLVKPSAMAPFFWIVIFVPGSLRPAVIVVMAYALLILIGAWGQQQEPISLMEQWVARARGGVRHGTSKEGYANVIEWVNILDIKFSLHVSLTILAILGAWVLRFRKIDLWLLMGVVALTARFWTYHAWYDDMLLLIPMITLFRIAKQNPAGEVRNVVAGVACALMMCTLLAPGGLYLFPEPLNKVYVYWQVSIWFFVSVFLLEHAWHESRN